MVPNTYRCPVLNGAQYLMVPNTYRCPVFEQFSREVGIIESVNGCPVTQELLQSLGVLQLEEMIRVLLYDNTETFTQEVHPPKQRKR